MSFHQPEPHLRDPGRRETTGFSEMSGESVVCVPRATLGTLADDGLLGLRSRRTQFPHCSAPSKRRLLRLRIGERYRFLDFLKRLCDVSDEVEKIMRRVFGGSLFLGGG